MTPCSSAQCPTAATSMQMSAVRSSRPAPMTRGILDVLAELQPVLDVVGDVALAALGVARPPDAAQHDEVAVLLEVAGIAGVQPAAGERLLARRPRR